MDTSNQEIVHDVFPYLRVYKDGTVERIAGTETVSAECDPQTGVTSKDIVIIPETGVSARLYRPNLPPPNNGKKKLPLVIYFHGGAFVIATAAYPKYHESINRLVAEAKVIAISVNYRLAPEFPLPIAYEDSWDVLQWVASHATSTGEDGDNDDEPWLKEHVDFERVYLAGDSAGANIAHHLAIRATDSDLIKKLKFLGIVSIHPYFWGVEPIGLEVTDSFRKALVDKWWQFVCPSDKGSDDPLINPFVDGAPSMAKLACDRMLVCVAEKDILRDRGILYYESLAKNGWPGKAEFAETEGEDHVFHIFDPNCDKAKSLIKRLACFINQEEQVSAEVKIGS